MKFTRRKKLPVVLEPVEAQRLLKQPNKRYLTGLRNKAIMLVMLNMGLRVSEITDIRSGNINITSKKVRIVNGKGGLDRDLVIPAGIEETLRQWKSRKPRNTKYFFTTLKGKQLSTRYLCEMVKRYSKKAGINKNISPHTLRHTYATEYYRQTKDIETLRRILGHADISTTTIYITLGNSDVEKGMSEQRLII